VLRFLEKSKRIIGLFYFHFGITFTVHIVYLLYLQKLNFYALYKKGLHLISEFSVKNAEILKDCKKMEIFLNSSIQKFGLTKIGDVFHQFPNSGYTGMICLTESHISIHTWPEFNRVTFDVFLSNFMNYNDAIAENIHAELLTLLEATDVNTSRLKR
jgi:S-adenosylmethionine decarboxylase